MTRHQHRLLENTRAAGSQGTDSTTRQGPWGSHMRTVLSPLRTRPPSNSASGAACGLASATHAMAAAQARPWPRLLGRCADHLTRLWAEETQGKSLSPLLDSLSRPPLVAAGTLCLAAPSPSSAPCRRRRPSSSAAPSVGGAGGPGLTPGWPGPEGLRGRVDGAQAPGLAEV